MAEFVAAYGTYMAVAAAAASAIYTGDQQRKSTNYQADIAKDNAKSAALQANAAEEQTRRQMRLRLGEQRASAAQSGFDSTEGSFGNLQMQSAANAELDALTTRYTGQMQSLSFDNQAAGLRANASAANAQGYVNAFGALAGGAAKYGSGLKIQPTSGMTSGYIPPG